MLLGERRHIIEPVEIRYRLQIGLVLDQFLGAAMQQSDMRIDPFDHFAVKLQNQSQNAVRCRMLRPEIDGEIARRGCGFGHHATCEAIWATLAIFAASRALNLSHCTMKRSCRPSPIRSRPSCALTLKVTRCPVTATQSTSTVTVMPGGVAARWLTSTRTPRLPSPGSRCGASNCVQAHSISTIMKPVAKTLGIAAISGDSG